MMFRTSSIRVVRLVLHLVLAASTSLAQTSGGAATGLGIRAAFRNANPVQIYRQSAEAIANHEFFGANLAKYPTMKEALIDGSLMPADVDQNVRGAITGAVSPVSMVAALLAPLTIEASKEISSGQGISLKKLGHALDPAAIVGSYVGGAVGGISGALVQSTLCSLGPVGAVAGFVANSSMSFMGTFLGSAIGHNVGKGQTIRAGIANALRQVNPGRDLGMMIGSTIGVTLGQVLIPIPVLGGLIGSGIGSALGAWVGNQLSTVPPFKSAFAGIGRALHRLADWIEGKKKDVAEGSDGGVAPPPAQGPADDPLAPDDEPSDVPPLPVTKPAVTSIKTDRGSDPWADLPAATDR